MNSDQRQIYKTDFLKQTFTPLQIFWSALKVVLVLVEYWRHTKCTNVQKVRAGNLGQISTLTLDCGVIDSLRTLLSREDWLILI